MILLVYSWVSLVRVDEPPNSDQNWTQKCFITAIRIQQGQSSGPGIVQNGNYWYWEFGAILAPGITCNSQGITSTELCDVFKSAVYWNSMLNIALGPALFLIIVSIKSTVG